MASAKNVVVVENPSLRMKRSQLTQALADAGAKVVWHANWAELKHPNSGLAEADVVLGPGTCPDFEGLIRDAPRLRGVVAVGAGTDGFSQDVALRHGVVIGYGAFPENTESMAEATVLFMLSLLYRSNETQELMRGGWPSRPTANARMLKGTVIGLIGFGRIARAVAERLSTWGVSIQVYSPRVGTKHLPDGIRSIELLDLLRFSDIVSVHVPYSDQTRDLLDAEKLRRMKRGAFLINTSRGGIVDEDVVAEMLKDGSLGGAAFDVFEKEPLPEAHPLRRAPNVVLTPHRLGLTAECLDALAVTAVENVTRILRSRPPLYTKNPEVLSRWAERLTVQV